MSVRPDDVARLPRVSLTVSKIYNRIIGLVDEQAFGLVHERPGAEIRRMVMSATIARRQGEGDRSATIIGQSIDLLVLPPRERPIASANSPFFDQRPSGAL